MPDEWKTTFATWTDVSDGPPEEMVVELLRRHGREFNLQQVLALSRPRTLGRPDEQLSFLQDFIGDTCEYSSMNFNSPAQPPQAWVDHQLWLDNEAGGMTIPGLQPKRILSNADLDSVLRPIMNPILTFSGHVKCIYRRLLYIADSDPYSVLAMIRQATTTQAWALGELLRGHFDPEPEFCLQIDVIPETRTAAFVFHMPYLALVREKRLDIRKINGRRLRETYDLSCLRSLGLRGNASHMSHGPYMTEAVMSITVNVRDDRWWEVYCLNDEFPFEESRLEEDDTKEPEVTLDSPEIQGLSASAGDSPSRRSSYPGLERGALDQGDPVLNIPNSYSHWNPRVYALKAVERQLEHIVQCQETLFAVVKKDCRTYKRSELVDADQSQKYMTSLSADEIRDAINLTLGYMRKIFDTVKQQHEHSQDFLYIYLGIDKTKPRSSWVFGDSLFVGLNNNKNKSDLRAMENCVGISHSIDRLHSLQHAIEKEIESLIQLKDTHRERMAEQQKALKMTTQAWIIRLGLLAYFIQALTIPLALYDIPNETTHLPNDSKGLVGVTLGLTAAFLVAPILIWSVCLLIPTLRLFIRRRWLKSQAPLLPVSKARMD